MTTVSTTDYDIYGEHETHWLDTIEPWNHQEKVNFLKDFWYKPMDFIRTNTFPTDWDAFATILDADLATRENIDCIHCEEPIVNMMKYMRRHAATCPKLKHYQHLKPEHKYLCPKCNETCKRNLTMEVHLRYNHYCKKDNETEEFHCNQCNYTVFPDLERLHYHKRLHRNTPVFKSRNESHIWTVHFTDILPQLMLGDRQDKYEQDMSTDELEMLMEKPELFEEGSEAIERALEKEVNDSLEIRKILLSGNTQWQVDIYNKYANKSTIYLSTRSYQQILDKNRNFYMKERKEIGLEPDYFYRAKYTNKYTPDPEDFDYSENRRRYAKNFDWNKTRVEAFEEFDREQEYRRYSILCMHLNVTPTTILTTTVDYVDVFSSEAEGAIDCSHYSPPSKEKICEYDNSKDWNFTPL